MLSCFIRPVTCGCIASTNPSCLCSLDRLGFKSYRKLGFEYQGPFGMGQIRSWTFLTKFQDLLAWTRRLRGCFGQDQMSANPWVLSLVRTEGIELEVSRHNHLNIYRHYLVPQK